MMVWSLTNALCSLSPWGPGSVHLTSSGPMKADLRFDDRDGHHRQGTITVEAVPADSHQFIVRIATARAGQAAPMPTTRSSTGELLGERIAEDQKLRSWSSASDRCSQLRRIGMSRKPFLEFKVLRCKRACTYARSNVGANYIWIIRERALVGCGGGHGGDPDCRL